MSRWEVIVGNVGAVYDGPNGFEAIKAYGEYVAISKAGEGRAGYEPVYLMRNRETRKEFNYSHKWEYTDTFGGEANYCWVKRGKLRAKNWLGAVRMAKRAAGLSGVRGRTTRYGDMVEFRPYGACTVLFVNWNDE